MKSKNTTKLDIGRILFAMGAVASAGCGASNRDESLVARIESVAVRDAPGASNERREQTSVFYRHSDGRTRVERDGKVFLGARGDKRRIVLDPVRRTVTELRAVPAPAEGTLHPIGASDPVRLETTADEDMGTKMVAGRPAVGRRQVFAVPAGVIHDSAPYEVEREQWTASGVDLPLVTVLRNGANHTTTTVTVTPLDVDVRASMFEIPAGYARVD